MTPLAGRQQAAVEPVSAAMLRRATAEAEAIMAAARRDAAALLAAARRDAEAALGQARADGIAQAAPLAAERGLHHQAERRIRAAVVGLRDQPGYGELRDRLTALSRTAAGPGAAVSEHPAGGVVAHVPGVFVDCSLPRLADRVIGDLGPRISELCAS